MSIRSIILTYAEIGSKETYNGAVTEDNTIFGSRTYKANIASRKIAINHTGKSVDRKLEGHGYYLNTDKYDQMTGDRKAGTPATCQERTYPMQRDRHDILWT